MSLTITKLFTRTLSGSLALATLAAASALVAPSAQAAIITGTVSGTWDNVYGGGSSIGDLFTATYSYDDEAITPYDNSATDVKDVGYTGSLLSLVVNSGVTQTFDFSSGFYSINQIYFNDYEEKSPTYTPLSQKTWQIFAEGYNDSSPSLFNSFYAQTLKQVYNGAPYEGNYVEAFQYDYNIDTYTYSGSTNSPTFNPDPLATTVPTAVPTPAMLPSLVGIGIAAIRKRKQAVAVSQDA